MYTARAYIWIWIFALSWNIQTSCSLKRPHIVFIVADDLGWNDVSFHGSQQIPTPNIDIMASDGIILNKYYTLPLCTPSRGALMTGKYPIHLGLQHYVIPPDAPYGLSLSETILPQYLKELGYATHGVGKWHLGFFKEEYLPTQRGFDSFFGFWTGDSDYYTHTAYTGEKCGLDFHDGAESTWAYNGYYSTELFTSKATDIIFSHNASQPLFLYVAHQAVHAANIYSPLQSPPEYKTKFTYIKDDARRDFAGIVSALDFSIGELLKALQDSNMLNDAIIIFTTDNGAAVQGIDESTGSNWPLRGSKYTLWEGGIRGVAWGWSRSLRQNKGVVNDLMHMIDWLPTLLAAAGFNPYNLSDLDGINMWPTILHKRPSIRQEILHNIDPVDGVEALQVADFKYINGTVFNGNFDGWFNKEGKRTAPHVQMEFTDTELIQHKEIYEASLKESQAAKIMLEEYGVKVTGDYIKQIIINCNKTVKNSAICKPAKAPCLFDLKDDPCEYNNIATARHEVVEEMEKLLSQYKRHAVPPRNKPADMKSNPKYHGYAWVPWK